MKFVHLLPTSKGFVVNAERLFTALQIFSFKRQLFTYVLVMTSSPPYNVFSIQCTSNPLAYAQIKTYTKQRIQRECECACGGEGRNGRTEAKRLAFGAAPSGDGSDHPVKAPNNMLFATLLAPCTQARLQYNPPQVAMM